MFDFHDPGRLLDGDLELVLVDKHPGCPDADHAPRYEFKMTLAGQGEEIGRIELRVGSTDHLILYAGQIGYRVHRGYRGQHYAARACRLLLPLARSHGLVPLWITCNPDNIASRRTCELAGAEMVGIVDLPQESDMYQRGERQKCRYRLDVL
jgi:tagatose 1,6-diphosphate aldolase